MIEFILACFVSWVILTGLMLWAIAYTGTFWEDLVTVITIEAIAIVVAVSMVWSISTIYNFVVGV